MSVVGKIGAGLAEVEDGTLLKVVLIIEILIVNVCELAVIVGGEVITKVVDVSAVSNWSGSDGGSKSREEESWKGSSEETHFD